jgi:hypothetical protein
MSINIEGLVNDAREESIQEEDSDLPTDSLDKRETDSSQWETFEQNLQSIKKKSQKTARIRQFCIDENIVDVLELCTFGKNSLTNVVNAILLTFIQEHKLHLRTLLKPTPSLIQ